MRLVAGNFYDGKLGRFKYLGTDGAKARVIKFERSPFMEGPAWLPAEAEFDRRRLEALLIVGLIHPSVSPA